jgi:hypothetical protein
LHLPRGDLIDQVVTVKPGRAVAIAGVRGEPLPRAAQAAGLVSARGGEPMGNWGPGGSLGCAASLIFANATYRMGIRHSGDEAQKVRRGA